MFFLSIFHQASHSGEWLILHFGIITGNCSWQLVTITSVRKEVRLEDFGFVFATRLLLFFSFALCIPPTSFTKNKNSSKLLNHSG